MITNILVICIGNICRSPMAEGLLKRAMPEANVSSAGTHALVGKPADPFSVQIMQEQGIDITGHRARLLTTREVAAADLILTMDLEQKRFVESRYPAARGKVFRLGEFKKYDIADPYRKGIEEFRRAHELIAAGVDVMAERMAQMA